ncbi:MAG: class I SAM-dependent RNA methyltransferase [Beutenbergiaceae bacterium]
MAEAEGVGAHVSLEIGQPVHGGHALARYQGRVVFVRHAIPGERAMVRLTEQRRGYWRGDAVDVDNPSPDRVSSRWPAAGPGGVGGGELAHISLAGQRRWKREVVLDAMTRIAGIDAADDLLSQFGVSAVPGAADGTGYRTRIDLTADSSGRAGMYRYRTHEIATIDSMPLAVPEIQSLDLCAQRWPAGARIEAVAPSAGKPVVLVNGRNRSGGSPGRIRERVELAGEQYHYRVDPAGFWQIHRAAPAVLAQAVIEAAALEPGMRVLDGYAGAGLFSAPLAAAVQDSGEVVAVEADQQASADARRNAAGIAQIRLLQANVANALQALDHAPDVAVLDPPRSGAGRSVIEQLARLRVPRIVYVACDPASLARDVAHARSNGMQLRSLTGYDIFPHTHHVELVATFTRAHP